MLARANHLADDAPGYAYMPEAYPCYKIAAHALFTCLSARSTMKSAATALGSWVAVLAQTVDSLGVDSHSLLIKAGIDAEVLNDPDARLPVEKTFRLWALAVQETAQPLLGLLVAKRVKPTSFHALGYALMACGTLREMLHWLTRYAKVVSDAGEIVVTIEHGRCSVDLRSFDEGRYAHQAAIDALMLTIVRACRLLLGPTLRPQIVCLQRSEPSDVLAFPRAFCAPLRFDAPTNCVIFEASVLDQPNLMANPALARANEMVTADYMMRLDKGDICNRVRLALIGMLPDGEPAMSAVAQAIALSERSLQRRLANAGTSFRELLNETRREQACMLLREKKYSVNEVGYMLGFTEQSTFTRAFRRWLGCSPSQWRGGSD